MAVSVVAVLVIAVKAAHHAEGEVVGLVLGVGPENVMAELVVDRIDPFALGLVFSAALPVFGMNEVDLPVLVSLAGGFAPVDILVPLDFRKPQVVIAAERGDRPLEVRGAVILKE